MSRSASQFESGVGRGMGFRDSNQDLLGFVHLAPERARQRILDIAATQLPTGGAYHQYQPLTKRGNNAIGSGFNDDPLWLILGTGAYLKETGDVLDPRRTRPVRQRPGDGHAALRAPAAQLPLHAGPARPARPAADRPRGLERLPEPELLLRHAGRELPDHREPARRQRRIGLHRRAVLPRRSRAGRHRPRCERRPTRRRRTRAPRSHGSHGRRAWLGRGLVPPRLRLLRQPGRLRAERRGPDLHRAAGHVRPRRASGSTTAGPSRRCTACASGWRSSTASRILQPSFTQLPRRARRDLHVPARVQGERRASSATRTRG